ncbi:uncharacterized protein LOC141596752 [Silene latifolia]|uniref:uncharacterized protein LOC141596752 n=1 Tax=Silene latifolia TaxID=37657 RepID=UPI003D78B034
MEDETSIYEASPTRLSIPPKMEPVNGDFTRLNRHYQCNTTTSLPAEEQSPLLSSSSNPNFPNHNHIDDNNNTNDTLCFSWMRIESRSKLWFLRVVFCAIISVSAVVLVKRYGSDFVHKELIPVIHWLVETFRPPVLAAILFAANALLPVLLLPSLPFKWVAGMTFGYGFGFLLIMAAETIAVSLPYFIANHLFLPRLKKWLDNHPREASIIGLAGDGDWFHQFRAVALIRVAPFPYVLFNYTAVATGVEYSPYLAGSLLGIIPETFVAIYSGILIRTVAEAMEDHTPVSKRHILLDAIGFCLTLAATVVIGLYSKRRLKQLQEDEEQPWQPL